MLKLIRLIGLQLVKFIFFILIGWFCIEIFKISINYISSDSSSFLFNKSAELKSSFKYRYALVTHGVSMSLALLIASFQFVKIIRRTSISIHKFLWWFTLTLVVVFGVPTGLYIAFFSEAKVPFLALNLITTLLSMKIAFNIYKKNIKDHFWNGVRLYFILLSAILQRLLLMVVLKLELATSSLIYNLIVWLSFILPLFVIEFIKLNSKHD